MKEGYIAPQQRKKMLFICDDIRMHSGIATMSLTAGASRPPGPTPPCAPSGSSGPPRSRRTGAGSYARTAPRTPTAHTPRGRSGRTPPRPRPRAARGGPGSRRSSAPQRPARAGCPPAPATTGCGATCHPGCSARVAHARAAGPAGPAAPTSAPTNAPRPPAAGSRGSPRTARTTSPNGCHGAALR